MTQRILDRVQETTTSTGTGALVLAGAVSKMFSFSGAGFADGDTFWGLIEHASAAEWEIAFCTWHTGPNITRATPLKSSNANAAVNFSAGTKTISLVAPSNAMREVVAVAAISAGAITFDLATAGVFTVANNANATLTVSNPVTGMLNILTAQLTADGTLRTWTWPGTWTWLTGTPVLTSTNGKRDLFQAISLDGGASYLATMLAQGY